MKKKSSKLSLGRETVVNLDQVSAGTPIPVTSACVTIGIRCQSLTCFTCIVYG